MSLSEAVPVFSHSRPVATVYLVVGDRRRLSGLDSRGPVFAYLSGLPSGGIRGLLRYAVLCPSRVRKLPCF